MGAVRKLEHRDDGCGFGASSLWSAYQFYFSFFFEREFRMFTKEILMRSELNLPTSESRSLLHVISGTSNTLIQSTLGHISYT
jgi:hypothetical protein